jgi:hypothetical protein
MPFDGKLYPQVEARARLVRALREPMPSDFEWYFGVAFTDVCSPCGTTGCAMGLAYMLGIVEIPCVEAMKSSLGLSKYDTTMIFLTRSFYGVDDFCDVTPAMVADALEQAPFVL